MAQLVVPLLGNNNNNNATTARATITPAITDLLPHGLPVGVATAATVVTDMNEAEITTLDLDTACKLPVVDTVVLLVRLHGSNRHPHPHHQAVRLDTAMDILPLTHRMEAWVLPLAFLVCHHRLREWARCTVAILVLTRHLHPLLPMDHHHL